MIDRVLVEAQSRPIEDNPSFSPEWMSRLLKIWEQTKMHGESASLVSVLYAWGCNQQAFLALTIPGVNKPPTIPGVNK